jgi:CBS domain-containing protein
MTSPEPTDREQRIPRQTIRSARIIVGVDGKESTAATVYCPVQERSCAVRKCEACHRFHSLHFDASTRKTSVVCHTEHQPPSPAEEAALRDAVGGLPDPTTPLADLMTKDVVCVRPWVALDEIVALLVHHGIGGVPVVDADAKPVGMVSRADVVRCAHDRGDTDETERATARPHELAAREIETGSHVYEPVRVTAADVMCPVVLTLHESSNIGQAASLMAYEGVHRLPIVSDDGSVVGIVSSLDILRWFGRRSGYVIPKGGHKRF